MEALEVLSDFPLINAAEAAAIMGVHVTTARRRFQELIKDGLATYGPVGRNGHREQRWILTREGVERQFQFLEDVPWSLKEPGIRSLYGRIEQLRALYRIAPSLFDGRGRDWHELPFTPRLTGCRFIRGASRGAGLIQAVLTYTPDITIFFCWVGSHLQESQMMQRWERRFAGLETYSESDYFDSLRNPFIDPPDPDHDPTPYPSGYLVVASDGLAMLQAGRNLPRDCGFDRIQPFLFVNAKSDDTFCEGVVRPRPHDTVRHAETWPPGEIGNPQRAAGFDGTSRPEDILGGAVASQSFDLVAEWPGLRVKDIARRCQRSGKEVHALIQDMTRADLLQEHDEMLYLGERGILYLSRRDRVSAESVRRRVKGAAAQDHRQVGSHRRHTIAVNQLMLRLYESGITPFAGWRAVLNIPNVTQPNPDLVIYADTPLGVGLYYIEVERTAVHPMQVSRKIGPYREAHRMDRYAPVIFITEKPEAEELFRRQSRGLPVLTCTLADTRRGPLAGESTVWRHDGKPVPLRPVV